MTPDLAGCKLYLDDAGVTYVTPAEGEPDAVADALAAETASQGARCTIPDDGADPPAPAYTADLVEALYARTARRLVLRGLPLGVSPTITDGAAVVARVGGLDSEVRRLEGPYRRVVLG